jgi:hypothetical protein
MNKNEHSMTVKQETYQEFPGSTQVVAAGEYWRAKKDIDNTDINEGDVLLVSELRHVEKVLHTIILRCHPKMNTSRAVSHTSFLAKDFWDNFEIERNGEELRKKEIAVLQEQISMIQIDINDESAKPCHGDDTVALLASPGLGEQAMAISEHGSAVTKRLNDKIAIIQQKTDDIKNIINQLSLYYDEFAASAIAKTQHIQDQVSVIKRGIESLDLYLLKDVVIDVISSGESADKKEKLSLTRKKLYMNEELSLFSDSDSEFDLYQQEDFFQVLIKEKKLVQQIFPTERCAVLMGINRVQVNYGNAFDNYRLNKINKETFILIRDGENIYRVCSPVASHLSSEKFFPTLEEVNSIFKDWNHNDINYDDVKFTDKLSLHENVSVHYKRLLILLCGLDHHKNIFGNFYDEPKSLNFVSLDFQDKYIKFIFDDSSDCNFGYAELPSFTQWLREKNKYLSSGSSIIVRLGWVVNSYTAPFMFSNCEDSKKMLYKLKDDPSYRLSLVYTGEKGLEVIEKVVKNEIDYFFGNNKKTKEYNCHISLSSRYFNRSDAFLCIDDVSSKELKLFLGSRSFRSMYIDNIELIKNSLIEVEKRERNLSCAIEFVKDNFGANVGDDELINKLINIWYFNNKDFPDNYEDYLILNNKIQLLFKVVELKKYIDQISLLSKAENIAILKIIVDVNGNCYVYYVNSDDSKNTFNHLLGKSKWVVRQQLRILNKKMSLYGDKEIVNCAGDSISFYTLYENSDAELINNYKIGSKVFKSYSQELKFIGLAGSMYNDELMGDILCHNETFDRYKFLNMLVNKRQRLMLNKKFVTSIELLLPIGIGVGNNEPKIVVLSVNPWIYLYNLYPEDTNFRKLVITEFVDVYANKDVKNGIIFGDYVWGFKFITQSSPVESVVEKTHFNSSNFKLDMKISEIINEYAETHNIKLIINESFLKKEDDFKMELLNGISDNHFTLTSYSAIDKNNNSSLNWIDYSIVGAKDKNNYRSISSSNFASLSSIGKTFFTEDTCLRYLDDILCRNVSCDKPDTTVDIEKPDTVIRRIFLKEPFKISHF